VNHILQTAVGGLSIGAVYALVALGFSIVRTMGLVNFGHADILMVGAFLTATHTTHHLPFAIALIFATGGVAGMDSASSASSGLSSARSRPHAHWDDRLRNHPAGRRTVDLGSVGTAPPTPITNTPINVGGIVIRAYDLLVLGTATAVMVSLYIFLNHSKRGAAMQAAAMDYDAATAVGINVPSCNGQAFAIGAGMAAVAGALVGPLVYVSVGMGGSIGISRSRPAAEHPRRVLGGLALGLIQSFAQ
jgi:branched-chain amino acid transport system permease protein